MHEEERNRTMQALTKRMIYTPDGEKTISVHANDIIELDVDVDIMTVSAFYRNYHNTRGTLFEALYMQNIDVPLMANYPEIDLREQCNIWLSKETSSSAKLPIKRIGCIEMSSSPLDGGDWRKWEDTMLISIKAYFRMLEIASIMGIGIERIILPPLGSGKQRIPVDFIMPPVINECIRFLKNNNAAKEIMIVTNNHSIAFNIAKILEQYMVPEK